MEGLSKLKIMELQMGDRIKWTAGAIEHTGVFLDPDEEVKGMSNVMMHTRNRMPDCREVKVITKLLKLNI